METFCEMLPSEKQIVLAMLLPPVDFTAMTAKSREFDGFTTTLLYSKFQKHEIIKVLGKSGQRIWGAFSLSGLPVGWRKGLEF